MRAYLDGLRDLWREMDALVPHAPPGVETGGQITFIIFFGGMAIFVAAMLIGAK